MDRCWQFKKREVSTRKSIRFTTNPRQRVPQTGTQVSLEVLSSKQPEVKHPTTVIKPGSFGQSVSQRAVKLCHTEPSQVSCPLEDPALPLVSETEHKVGYCLCHLCSCGLHPCPAKKSHPLQAQPAASLYTLTYQGKPATDLLREVNCAPLQYRSLRPQQSLTSSYRTEYQPLSSTDRLQPVMGAPSMKNLEFVGRNSLYKREYPGWNVDEVVKFKAPVQQACLGLFEPAFVSSYQATYRPHSIKAKLCKGTRSHRLVKEKFTGVTTNQTSYQDRSVEGLTMNSLERSPEKPVSTVHAKPFASVYKGDFQALGTKWFSRQKGFRKSLG